MLWPAVLVSYLVYLLGHSAYIVSFREPTQNKQVFPCYVSKPKLALNHPTGGEMSALVRSNNPSD